MGSTQTLDISTIAQIHEISLRLAADEYAKFTKKNRNERRQVMHSDFDTYESLIFHYNEEVENIMSKANQALLAELGISTETFEDSVITLMERGLFQQIYMLNAAARQKIKESIAPTKEVTET